MLSSSIYCLVLLLTSAFIFIGLVVHSVSSPSSSACTVHPPERVTRPPVLHHSEGVLTIFWLYANGCEPYTYLFLETFGTSG